MRVEFIQVPAVVNEKASTQQWQTETPCNKHNPCNYGQSSMIAFTTNQAGFEK